VRVENVWMKVTLIAAVALMSLGFAHGQDAIDEGSPACPDGAADTMLQVAAQASSISDTTQLQNAFAYAKQLPAVCPSDAAVHFFSANALVVISDLVSEPQAKLERLKESTAAILEFDAVSDAGENVYVSALTDDAGAPVSVDMNAGAIELIAKYLAPKVVLYEANGLFHPWVSSSGGAAPSDAPCPYVHQAFATAEARGHNNGHSDTAPMVLDHGGIPNPVGSIRRIEYLLSTCSEQRREIAFQLVRLNVLFARISDRRDSDSENGYITRALEALEIYMGQAEGTPEAGTSQHGVAVRWQTEMLEMAAKGSD